MMLQGYILDRPCRGCYTQAHQHHHHSGAMRRDAPATQGCIATRTAASTTATWYLIAAMLPSVT